MSICYGIVKDHEGSIRVTSAPGEGATFTIELPCRKITPSVSESHAEPTIPFTRKGGRILVVDDEEMILTIVKRTLTADGFLVDTASSGMEALELLKGKPAISTN